MASFFDKQLEKLEINKISNTEFWPNDNELEKYKFPVNPKQLTGLAIKADLEKLDHHLYSSYVGIQSKISRKPFVLD